MVDARCWESILYRIFEPYSSQKRLRKKFISSYLFYNTIILANNNGSENTNKQYIEKSTYIYSVMYATKSRPDIIKFATSLL
jgi:hypothetical protein